MKEIKFQVGRIIAMTKQTLRYSDNTMGYFKRERVIARLSYRAISARLGEIRKLLCVTEGKKHSKLALERNVLRCEARRLSFLLTSHNKRYGEYLLKYRENKATLLETYASCEALGLDADACEASYNNQRKVADE